MKLLRDVVKARSWATVTPRTGLAMCEECRWQYDEGTVPRHHLTCSRFIGVYDTRNGDSATGLYAAGRCSQCNWGYSLESAFAGTIRHFRSCWMYHPEGVLE